jgi:1-phosphatidylinositol-4-phosphate 5-kinase
VFRCGVGINSRLTNNAGRGDEVYFMGIIDILQQYNFRKRSETFFKGFTEDVNLISSVHPIQYAKRFVQFLRDNTD